MCYLDSLLVCTINYLASTYTHSMNQSFVIDVHSHIMKNICLINFYPWMS